jgi:hypothetical protein
MHTVSAENVIRCLSLHLKGLRAADDRVVRVPSIPLPARLANVRLAASVTPGGVVEVRRDPAVASSADGAAAPAACSAEHDLGRPSSIRGPALRRPTPKASGPEAVRHAADRAALASRHRSAPLGRQVRAQATRPAHSNPRATRRPTARPSIAHSAASTMGTDVHGDDPALGHPSSWRPAMPFPRPRRSGSAVDECYGQRPTGCLKLTGRSKPGSRYLVGGTPANAGRLCSVDRGPVRPFSRWHVRTTSHRDSRH